MVKLMRLVLLVTAILIFNSAVWARIYDPGNGRFLQEDPIGFEGGDVNLFAYTENNPVNYTDPWGLYSENPFAFFYDLDNFAIGTSNFSAGYGDALTSLFGFFDTSLTEQTREELGINWNADECGGFFRAGRIGAYSWAAITSGAVGARLVGWQTRVGLHGPHHQFGRFGRLSHLQLNYWKNGISKSGRAIRFPLPWR
ncbi:MAG: hypothetical protein A2901_03535 [Elusimicrobia bacterium RIFCSPLOWO2_01_FULL_54_10]|nr:MAG: hypothetical protein A2901_03535 [Elusimicrobia bacterium RIFCSPLOWO2_01_FULL_54_10]